MVAFSLSLPYRHRQGAWVGMAMRRQPCGQISRHVGATPDLHHVAIQRHFD